MFNFSRKDTEFFDLFLENARYFHLGAVFFDEVIKDLNKIKGGVIACAN